MSDSFEQQEWVKFGVAATLSKQYAADQRMFPYVTLGELRHFGHKDTMGQNAGCLGRAYDPFAVPFVQPFGAPDVRLDMRVVDSMFGDVATVGQQLDRRRPLLEASIAGVMVAVSPALVIGSGFHGNRN